MSIEYNSIIDQPLPDVFAWHTRPGAMTRLIPPWQPMRVVSETESRQAIRRHQWRIHPQ
jgi:ligand-binding SRPBCC domain-containing protein